MWITLLMTVGLKALEMFLDYTKAKAETKKAFLDFISKIETDRAPRLRQSYADQLKRLQDELSREG